MSQDNSHWRGFSLKSATAHRGKAWHWLWTKMVTDFRIPTRPIGKISCPCAYRAWGMKKQPLSSGCRLPELAAPTKAPCQVTAARQPLLKCTSVPSLSKKSCSAMNIKKTLSNKYFWFHVHLSQQLYSNDSVCCYLRDKIPRIRQ